MTSISKIECGGFHALALKTDGTLWATGRNERGQLGTGDGLDRYLFTSVP
ncbi:MAG: hypothetical protein EHM28_08355 [Spirochaetaceae bacterium]|nr:MAG: hypothetical protein EHM28_08355 [Spirochaetaceae bacterium]